jgi:hypothetical protein
MPRKSDMNKPNQEHRNYLTEAHQKAYEDFDKTVLLLSGGALGVSITFVKDIIGPGMLLGKRALLWSWGCWVASLLMVLLSYYFSQLTLSRAIAELDAGLNPQRPGGVYRKFTLLLNALSGLLFFVGLILFIIFVSKNLEVLNVRTK